MASRKSCTHLTWAEAKGTTGGTKKPLISTQVNHGKALTAKIVAKQKGSAEDKLKDKIHQRRIKKDEEKAAIMAMKRVEEKERERQMKMVRPFDQAQARLVELAERLQLDDDNNVKNNDDDDGDDDVGDSNNINADDISIMKRVAECRELHVIEVMGIESMYAGTDQLLLISNTSDLDTLQHHIDEWQMDGEAGSGDNDALLLQNIVQHPPTSFTIQLTIDGNVLCDNDDDIGDNGNSSGNSESSSSIELAASLLLKVTLPPSYPLDGTTAPVFSVEYLIATDRDAICNPEKPLESSAYLDENQLYNALREEAKHILPDPCVYEVVGSWLTEHLFDYLKISVHARHALQAKQRQLEKEESGIQ